MTALQTARMRQRLEEIDEKCLACREADAAILEMVEDGSETDPAFVACAYRDALIEALAELEKLAAWTGQK